MFKVIFKDKSKQFIKYCIVGGLNTFIDIGALYLFVEYLKIAVIPSSVLSFIIAVANSFLMNKLWTFKDKSTNYRKQFIKFLIVSIIGLGLNTAFMFTFVSLLSMWYILSKIITSLIVLTWNFLVNRFWTFRLFQQKIEIPQKFEKKLSIIVPAYNEAQRIVKTVISISDYIKTHKINAEIIIVDDGSKDKTTQVINVLANKIQDLRLVSYKPNQGKGFAVKKGVEESKGKFILFTDADNSTPIEEYENLKKSLDKASADIAIGSRYLPGSNVKIKQPFSRILIGRLGNLLIRFFLIENIQDTQCGFKLFKHEAAKNIFFFQKIKRFAFDMEALTIANHLGYKIIEIPVTWTNSADSRLRPVRDSIRTLRDLIFIKLNLLSGRYRQEKTK
ncbi:MAG: glycosyltransferase [Candidatus Gracilibacteria bacterium]